MSTLPASGYLENDARTEGEMKQALEDIRDVIEELPGGEAESELTISSGSITPTDSIHSVDTEGDAGSDYLDNILQTNTPDGRILFIHPEDDARTIVVRNAQGGTGQILTADGLSVTLDDTGKWMLLKRTSTNWEEIGRFYIEASTTQKGIVELATDAETQSLSSDDVVVTPGNLGNLDASTSQKGILETATGAETATGTATDKAVTPDSLADLLQYDYIWIPASAMIPCTTDGATASTEEYGTNDIDLDILAFSSESDLTEERAQFNLVMPAGWDRSTIKAKFYWTNASGASAADTVEWGLKAGALSNDDAIDAALGTPQVISDTLLADGDLHISDATPAITVGGTPALEDMIQFEVYRNVDGTDDMVEDAWLIGLVIEYKKTNTVSAWA
jgi:hypothetical protein